MQTPALETDPPRHVAAHRIEPSILDAALRELSDDDWPAPALRRYLPRLVRVATTLAPAQRLPWLIGLRQCWERHGHAFDAAAKAALLELAAAWACWPLVIAVGETLPARGTDEAMQRRLCDAYHAIGRLDAAIDLSVAMQLAWPARRDHAANHRHLLAWRGWRERATLSMAGIAHPEDPLSLEPLGHQHAADFAWQYYDPAIAQLCCLPQFENVDQWHAWLDESYAPGDLQLFAVLHRQWGCIGCVGLVLDGATGFFFYWLGRDFQGYGFGPGAAAQLLAAAHRQVGMRRCYAKVYDYNAPSRAALAKIGFVDTGLRAAAPHQDQLFYRIGEPDSEANIARELHTLVARLDAEVRVAAPWTGLVI